MANMGYCRFENTVSALADCVKHVNDEDLSKTEQRARLRLFQLCQTFIEESDIMENTMDGGVK